MKIGYREEDNNKKVKLNIKSISKIAIASLAVTGVLIGSGALQVKANAIDSNSIKNEFTNAGYTSTIPEGTVWDAEKQFYYEEGQAQAEAESIATDRIVAEQIGYDAYINGENAEDLKNIDTMAELEAYEQGIERAEDSGIMQQKWEQMGYDFIAEGKLSESLDYDSKISNKLALQMDAYQKGIRKALEEGNVVDPNTITPLDENIKNPTPEQENLEVFRQMLLEGWVDMGKESVNDVDYFSDKNTSSPADRYFSQRSMPISGSDLINAGRVQAMKENGVISLEQLGELAEGEKMGAIKDAETAVKSAVKDIEVEKEDTYSLGD